ncbi:hypothetical protein FHX59_007296 [Paraburkholderia silvatlantica]|uniref:Uncharacterized protein n=1 Tax=Paraburkholderia silvatlantica TaxID=321895 RepID=A0ABR6FZD1_9BURK|nr:hypothetical protein [Paraburkholderia silvatlantica]PVY20778.1 hypothetical protein C7411_13953 [Paraburkholderia silvatlantica]PXW25218.1 hypothetical protein C7413_14153 [Paraburkholderia silvatlantica]
MPLPRQGPGLNRPGPSRESLSLPDPGRVWHGMAFPTRAQRPRDAATHRGWDRNAPHLRTVHGSFRRWCWVCPPPMTGGASPSELCTMSRPSPGASRSSFQPMQCRAAGAHEPGQIEPYPVPSVGRDVAGADRMLRIRFKVAGPAAFAVGRHRGLVTSARACSDLRRLLVGASGLGRVGGKLDLRSWPSRMVFRGRRFGLS